MPYTINKYNGQVVATVADGTIDSTTDLKLIGKNYAGYGEVQNENFLFLLENFANTTQPPKPLPGQLWYDSGNAKLKFYDGAKFRTTGGAEIGSTAPTGLTVGDFWWDTTNKQLYTWDGSTYVLVGPQGVAGSQTTQMRSRSVRDTFSGTHAIIEAVVNGNTIFTINSDSEFTLDPTTSSINGFTKIHQGITLAYTNDDSTNNIGQTQSNHRFWGTASDSERLGGIPAANFVQTANAQFDELVDFSNAGFRVGGKLRVFNSSNTTPTIQNEYNDTIEFKTYTSGSLKTPMKLVGLNIMPDRDVETDLGSGSIRFKTINAQTFAGTATEANSLYIAAGDYRVASSNATSGTVAVRTNTTEGNITAGALKATFFVGTATAANYADLAEKYLADAEYEPGTVVCVGGEKEVTAAHFGDMAIGVVSTNPAVMMNSDLEGGTYIALKGRVPVKILGKVRKGDPLIPCKNGYGQVDHPSGDTVSGYRQFGVALESSDDEGVKLVECLIL